MKINWPNIERVLITELYAVSRFDLILLDFDFLASDNFSAGVQARVTMRSADISVQWGSQMPCQ